MRRVSLLLALMLTLLLSGCGKAPAPPEPAAPLTHLDSLRVELSKNGLPAGRLLEAAKALPGLLQAYFAQLPEGQAITIDEIVVTVGASPAATAQALAAGTVDVAFLPPEELVLHGDGAPVLAADAPQWAISNDSTSPKDWNGAANATTAPWGDSAWQSGTFALICTAPTVYGGQLRTRMETAGADAAPTWEELNRARWGLLAQDSLGGRRCFTLWLADGYQGNTPSDLADVTVYESEEALLRAAARGEIDAFPLRADGRMEVASAWMLPESQKASGDIGGFGRTASVWEEIGCIGVTPTLYATAVAASPAREDLAEASFAVALDGVLLRLRQEESAWMEVLGAPCIQAVEPDALAPLVRLLTIEGRVE